MTEFRQVCSSEDVCQDEQGTCPLKDTPVQVQIKGQGGSGDSCSDMFLFFSQDFIPDFPYEPDAYDEELLR